MTPPQDILAALRDATASRHAELDQGMPLARPAPTLADYRAHLALLRRWLAPIEAWQGRYADGPQDAALLPPPFTCRQSTPTWPMRHCRPPTVTAPTRAGTAATARRIAGASLT